MHVEVAVVGALGQVPRGAGTVRRGGSSRTRRPTEILAVDFLHVDTVLLNRLYMLIFIGHGPRRMHLGGVTALPTGDWTVQQARNLAMNLGERLTDFRFLICDRRSDLTSSFEPSSRPPVPRSCVLL
jgi:putative transposase